MGLYEKLLGFGLVPFLFLLLLLLSTGVFRRQLNQLVQFLLKFNFNLNGRTVYFFPLIACVNLVWIIFLYKEIVGMHEPDEIAEKTKYYEILYRTYRNLMLNMLSVVLIF